MNYSDRFLGIMAGTKYPGNDPHIVAEAMRHNGLIPEEMLPFKQDLLATMDEYFSFKGANESVCRLKGKEFLENYELKHEYVWDTPQTLDQQKTLIKEYLQYSPLGITVTAWFKDGEVYVDNGQPNTHWVVCYGMNDKGYLIFDSYDHGHKILSFKHKISLCKRYLLKKKRSWWLFQLIHRLLN